MKILDLAWRNVKSSTILNCFAKAGISKEHQNCTKNDDNPFTVLQNQIKKLGDFNPPDTTAEDVISADKNLMSTVPSLTHRHVG